MQDILLQVRPAPVLILVQRLGVYDLAIGRLVGAVSRLRIAGLI